MPTIQRDDHLIRPALFGYDRVEKQILAKGEYIWSIHSNDTLISTSWIICRIKSTRTDLADDAENSGYVQ